jgi:hypothetical protein
VGATRREGKREPTLAAGADKPKRYRASRRLYVRREKVHSHQRVKVPPGELSIHPGSHRAGKVGDYLTRSPEEEDLERRLSEQTGRNASEARAGSERDDVDADPTRLRGRPRRWVEAIDQSQRSTGILGAACRHTGECATREA